MDHQLPLWEKVLRAVNSGRQPTEEQWQTLTPDEQELIDQLQKEKLTAGSVEFLNSVDEEKAWQKLSGNMGDIKMTRAVEDIPGPITGKVGAMRFIRYAAVFAGILLVGATAVLLFRNNKIDRPEISGKNSTEQISSRRAMLVLEDGKKIELDKNAGSGIGKGQPGIVNIDTALLRYSTAKGTEGPAGFNTLLVPRGGKYKIELADGSEVWLNAETKIRYPVHFGGVAKREVMLESGEAYFKIRQNAGQPFVVKTGGMDIQVLGTEFNLNTYTQQYATTLVNGSVKLSAGKGETLLKPGQQAIYVDGGFIRKTVHVETYTGWKDGQLIYEEAPLEEVMNNLGRDYDYAVEFTSPQLKEMKFGGRLRRSEQIEDVLAVIEKAGYVSFSLRGRTIFISPVLRK